MKNKKMSIIAALVAVFLIIGLATAFLTSAAKRPNPQPSPPETMEPTPGSTTDQESQNITEPPSSTERFEGMYTFSVQVAEGRELTIALDSTEPQKDYFSVNQVLVFEGKELIQTILPKDVPAVEDHAWVGLYVNQNSAVGEPDVRDLNFDGAEDFGLLAVSSYPHNVPYSYFLWDQETDRFVYGFTLCGSGALEIDLQNRQLIEEEHDVLGSYETIYAYAEDGSLQKQSNLD